MRFRAPHLEEIIDLDCRIEQAVKKNVDPKNGSKYWIKYFEEHGLKPIDVDSYDSLYHLGFHDWSVFKNGRFSELLPKDKSSYFKSASSGTTSQKKLALLPNSFLETSNEWWLYNLDRKGMPEGLRCWGVGSPEFWGKNVSYAIEKKNGTFLPVYVESRGGKEFLQEIEELQSQGKIMEAMQGIFERYTSLVEDTANIFKAMRPNAAVAPARVILEILPFILSNNEMSLEDYLEEFELVVSGGDELSEEMFKNLGETFPNAEIIPYLGHFMFGAAFGREGRNYYPNISGVNLQVVDEEGEQVKYGGHGRVVVNFYDNLLWRAKDDAGVREKPREDIEWDGVSGISRAGEEKSDNK